MKLKVTVFSGLLAFLIGLVAFGPVLVDNVKFNTSAERALNGIIKTVETDYVNMKDYQDNNYYRDFEDFRRQYKNTDLSKEQNQVLKTIESLYNSSYVIISYKIEIERYKPSEDKYEEALETFNNALEMVK